MQLFRYCKGSFSPIAEKYLSPKTAILLVLRMKCTLLIFLISIFEINAKAYSQGISLSFEEAPLEQVLGEIKQQSRMLFFYNKEWLNQAKPVNIRVHNASLQEVLETCFQQQPFSYTIVNNTIVLKKNENNPSIQQLTVSGKVTDENGAALPGVSLLIIKNKRGTTTDSDGSFRLVIPENECLVRFSYIGYLNRELTVSGGQTLNVVLQPDAQHLDEVVIVGYGSQDRKTITGSLAEVKGEELTKATLTSATEMLQGKVAGLQSVTSGQPGANTQIRIRGIGSITAGAEPLYVVDGVPVNAGNLSRILTTSNALAGINPADIESISVLKDAASASIYGSRAANGVVLITTKKGKSGPTRFQFDLQGGFTDMSLPKLAQPLSKDQYLMLTEEGLRNAAYQEDELNRILDAYGRNNPETNWLDEVTRVGAQQQYNVSANGGNEKTTFNTSLGYFNQQATTIGSDYQRITSNLNLQHKPSEKFSFTIGMNIGYNKQNTPSNSSYYANPIYAAFLLRPTQNPYNPDGTINLSLIDFPNGGVYNQIAEATFNQRGSKGGRGIGSGRIEYKPLKNLTLSSQIGVDFNLLEEYRYRDPNFGDGYTSHGNAYAYYTRYFNWTWTNLADYKWDFNATKDFYANLKVGYETQRSNAYLMNAGGQNFPGSQSLTALINAATPTEASQTGADYSFTSLLSQVVIDYKQRYNLSGSFRRDGSSRFGANNRYGNFYSIGAAWNVDQENFWKDNSILSSLKVRGSYGVNGNANINNYEWRATYGFGNNYNQNPGSAPDAVGNPNLTWELNKPFNMGFDASLLGNVVNITVDYYTRTTSQLLLNVPLSRTTGFNSMLDNVGAMVNKGWELTLNASPLRKALRWDLNFNIAINKNKIKTLYAGQDIIDGQFIRREGLDFQTFYMREWAGVDPANGNPLWYKNTIDANGATDRSTTNNYNEAQRINTGKSASPKALGGFGTTFAFKGLTLDAQFSYSFGAFLRDGWVNYYFSDGYNPQYNRQTRQLDRWQEPGDITDVPKYIYGGNLNSYQASTRFLYSGDYIRLRALTLSYSLPASLLQKLKFSTASVYIRGTNLLTKTFDKDLPMDPELGINGEQTLNPFMNKVFTLGVNFNF